jgi:hypothetical protein
MSASRSVVIAFVACVAMCGCTSSSSDGGCNVSYDCHAGQTCWSDDAKNFYCTTSGPGRLGDSCNKFSQPGDKPYCGDQLACAAFGTPTGNCTMYCNADGTCPSGGACQTFSNTSGGQFRVCH